MTNRTWMMWTRVVVLLTALGLHVGLGTDLAAAAPYDAFAVSGSFGYGGSDAFPSTLRQAEGAQAENPVEPDAAEPGRIAALTEIMNRQGSRSVEHLERVSASDVLNLTESPEFVVDARLERAMAAIAAPEPAPVDIEAQAQATAEAAVAAALAADQAKDEAEARAAQVAASATREAEAAAAIATQEANAAAAIATQEANAAAVATATADAQAAANAAREAEVVKARAEAQAAAVLESNRQNQQRVAVLVLSLALLAACFLILKIWRNRKEPFVLKAIPVSGTAHGHA